MKRDLRADLGLCKKATPGPWKSDPAGNWYGAEVNYWQVSNDYAIIADLITNKHDAEFIDMARDALPYWLERVQKLEAVAEAAKQLSNNMSSKQYWDYVDNMRETLAALESNGD